MVITFTIIWSQVRQPARLLCSRVVCFGPEVMELFALPTIGCIKLFRNCETCHISLFFFFFHSAFNFFLQSFPISTREQKVISQGLKWVFNLHLSQFMKKSFCLESFTKKSLYFLWSWSLSQDSSVDAQPSQLAWPCKYNLTSGNKTLNSLFWEGP